MLVNPKNKRTANAEFQRYLDARELQLYRQMQPLINATVRMSTRVGMTQAQNYLVERGEPLLLNSYKRVYRDQYVAVGAATTPVEGKALLVKAWGWEDPDEPEEPEDSWRGFLAQQLTRLSQRAGRKIRRISENLADAITDEIMIQLGEGKSNQAIAKEIQATAPEFSKARAATIARTETHASATAAMNDSLEYKKIKVKWKEWIAANDKRTRPAHKEMNGVKVKAEEVFRTADGPMRYPGDDTLGALPSGLINCRCSYIITTEQSAV